MTHSENAVAIAVAVAVATATAIAAEENRKHAPSSAIPERKEELNPQAAHSSSVKYQFDFSSPFPY